MNHVSLKKCRHRCCAKSPTVQDIFRQYQTSSAALGWHGSWGYFLPWSGMWLWLHCSSLHDKAASYLLRASCLMLDFKCHEAKIEESEKVHIEDCEGWWLSSCCGSVAEHWWLKPEVSWVWLLVTAGFFTFLYFHLITSKFIYALTKNTQERADRVRVCNSWNQLELLNRYYKIVTRTAHLRVT